MFLPPRDPKEISAIGVEARNSSTSGSLQCHGHFQNGTNEMLTAHRIAQARRKQKGRCQELKREQDVGTLLV